MLQFLLSIVLKSKCILYLLLTCRHIFNYRTTQQRAVRLNSMRADACLFINKEEEGSIEPLEDILLCWTFYIVVRTHQKQLEAHLPSLEETPELDPHLKLKNKTKVSVTQRLHTEENDSIAFYFPTQNNKTKFVNEREKSPF